MVFLALGASVYGWIMQNKNQHLTPNSPSLTAYPQFGPKEDSYNS